MNQPNYGDSLQVLPVDETPPTPVEANVLNRIFTEDKKNGNRLRNEVKDVAALIVLFIVISCEPFKNMLANFVPIVKKSVYIDIAIRAIIFAIAYYMFKNFFLVRYD